MGCRAARNIAANTSSLNLSRRIDVSMIEYEHILCTHTELVLQVNAHSMSESVTVLGEEVVKSIVSKNSRQPCIIN